MSGKSVLEFYREIDELSKSINEQEEDVSILFVDLAKSTHFKATHGAIRGLSRTFLHNSIVTNLAASCGRVVKYIGDEVMIVTSGAGHPIVACQLAKEIQKGIADLSQNYRDDPRFPLESKIGIHSGLVQYWRYPGHDQLDPQGTTVDIAARIVSLAKPQQVLCSEVTSTQSSLSPSELGAAAARYVKGIRDPIRVVEIMWDGQTRGVAQNSVPTTEDADVRKWLSEGQSHLHSADNQSALKCFETALKKAPADFNANFTLGEHLVRRMGDVREGRRHLAQARIINPSSPPLLLLEGFLEWRCFEKENQPGQLEEAIKLTEECLRLAEVTVDRHSTRLALGNLAYYLAKRGRTEDLERAQTLCEEALKTQKMVEGREMSGLLDTYALVLLRKGGKDDVVKARELLEEAIRRDSQNPYPHEHMAELIRMEQTLGIRPASGSIY